MTNFKRYSYLVVIALLVLAQSVYSLDLVHHSEMEFDFYEYAKKNRWTVVQIWSMDCDSCEEQKPMLDKFHQEHFPSSASVITIATDGISYFRRIRYLVNESNYWFETFLPKTELFYEHYKTLTGSELVTTPTYLFFRPGGEYVGYHTGLVSREQLEELLTY